VDRIFNNENAYRSPSFRHFRQQRSSNSSKSRAGEQRVIMTPTVAMPSVYSIVTPQSGIRYSERQSGWREAECSRRTAIDGQAVEHMSAPGSSIIFVVPVGGYFFTSSRLHPL
jgi:hypothetical protein